MELGLPSIQITFQEAAKTAYIRSQRGVVGLILVENELPAQNPAIVAAAGDIPSQITAFNRNQILMALQGYTQ